MLDITEGIVLKTTRYAESSVIVKIFTRKFGILSFMVQGVRSSRNKQKGNLLQPLHVLDLEIQLKEHRALHTIKEYQPAYIYKQMYMDMLRQSVAIFCIELIAKCMKEQEVNERLYGYLASFLLELDTSQERIQMKPLFFLMELASLLGFELSLQHISEGNYFNLASGRFEHTLSGSQPCLNAHETMLFKKLMVMYYEKDHDVQLSASERTLLFDKLLLYFRWHVDDFSSLKSPAILHEVLK